MILVTGGAGFIGGNFVLDWLANPAAEGIVNLDKLTYAGNLATLQSLSTEARHVFVKGKGQKDGQKACPLYPANPCLSL